MGKIRSKDGQRKAYGIPSQSQPGRYYLVNQRSCDCQDAQRHPGQACKHVRAVHIWCEIQKAQQPRCRQPARREVAAF